MNKSRPALAFGPLCAALALATAAHAGTFSIKPWTGDGSTNIEAGKTAWAYHFGASTTATVNGVTVPGLPGPTVTGNADFNLADTGFVFNPHANELTAAGGSGSAVMAGSFVFGATYTATLKGLTIGRSYTASIFGVGFEGPGARLINFQSPGSPSLLVDESQYGGGRGIRVDFDFTATAATQDITLTPANPTGSTWHLYGLALRRGTTFTVTSGNESGVGSLRTAVGTVGVERVVFAPALNGEVIDFVTISGDPPRGSSVSSIAIVRPIVIDASDLPAGITLDGRGNAQLLFISAPTTLINLKLNGGFGGAEGVVAAGGAIYSSSPLTLKHCTLSNNVGANGGGGAILATAGLTMESCMLSGNGVLGNGVPGEGIGGGAIAAAGEVSLLNCTFSGNGGPTAGAIRYFDNTGKACTLIHCTVAGNASSNTGGIGGIEVTDANATLRLVNTIVANNTAPGKTKSDVRIKAPVLSSEPGVIATPGTLLNAVGYNILTSPVEGLLVNPVFPLSTIGVIDPKLLPLGDNGGPTLTMLPGTGSRAIDGAIPLESLGFTKSERDQRGRPRGINGRNDVGAVEVGVGEFLPNGKLASDVVVVTTDVDELDPFGTNGAGVSLREALRDVKAGGRVAFQNTEPMTISLTRGPIVMDRDVTVGGRSSGPGGPLVTLNAGGRSRVIDIPKPDGIEPPLLWITLQNLGLSEGRVTDPDTEGGAGLRNNWGDVLMVDCEIRQCGADRGGGGILNQQVLVVDRCFFGGNRANGTTGSADRHTNYDSATGNFGEGGGAILNRGWAYVSRSIIVNSGAANGCAIAHQTNAARFANVAVKDLLHVDHCTIQNNLNPGGGAILASAPWKLSFSVVCDDGSDNNTIRGATDAARLDIRTSIVKRKLQNFQGAEVDRAELRLITGQPVLVGDDYAPLAGSPVIDAGVGASNGTDFYGRPVIGVRDVGAVESIGAGNPGTYKVLLNGGNPADPNSGGSVSVQSSSTGAATVSVSFTEPVPPPPPAPAAARNVGASSSAAALVKKITKSLKVQFVNGTATATFVVDGVTYTLVLTTSALSQGLTATLTSTNGRADTGAALKVNSLGRAAVPPTVIGRFSVAVVRGGVNWVYGTLTADKAGNVRFTGRSFDGASLSFATKMDANYRFEVRVPLYRGRGYFSAKAGIDSSGVMTTRRFFTGGPFPFGANDTANIVVPGFPANIGLNVSLNRYVAPLKGRQVAQGFAARGGLGWYYSQDYQISTVFYPSFLLSANGKAVTNMPGFKFSLSPTTGFFSGTVPAPDGLEKPRPFSGMIYQISQYDLFRGGIMFGHGEGFSQTAFGPQPFYLLPGDPF